MKIFLSTILLVILFHSTAKTQPLGGLTCDMILKAQFKKSQLKICNKVLDVEIADNDTLRALGLMCRGSLPENAGMVFIFDDERPLSFWMKDTKIPLSIGYFDKNKSLIDIHDMEPLNENKVYPSKKPSQYALETNQGWYKKNNVQPGCKFEFIEIKSPMKKPVTKVQ